MESEEKYLKVEHRIKAIEAYNGARAVLKQGLVYPSYILLKECTRAVLTYIAEDALGKNFSTKTKLQTVMELMTDDLVQPEYKETLEVLLRAERGGLQDILGLDINELKDVKRVLKQLIGNYLSEHV